MKTNLSLLTLPMLAALLVTGCGKPVPQNKLSLVVRTLGERSTSNATASAEIYWARRLPLLVDHNPAVRVFTFHLGLQDYSFTERPSLESPHDEAVEVDCLGGHLKFDANVQLYIDRNTTNLEGKLLQFINDYQLQSYSGEQNMLARWAGEKLRQFIREPLAQYALNKQAIDVMRGKVEMNNLLFARMNDRFNRYGIKFCAAGITSPIGLPADQKDRMNNIVKQEYANQALKLRNEKFMPLTNEVNRIEQDGLSQCQDEKNRGTQESIKLVADAQQERRRMFMDLVGESQYVTLEQMLTMVKSLESGNTKVFVVPKNVLYINMGDLGLKRGDSK